MSNEVNYTHTIPGKSDRRWFEPTWGQGLWLLFFSVMFIYFYQQQQHVAAIICALLGIAGAIPYREGPGYVIFNRWLRSLMIRRRKGGVIFSTSLADTLYEPAHPNRGTKEMPDVKLVSIPITDNIGNVHQLGLSSTMKNGHDTTYLSASGWSAAVLSDAPERMMYDMSFGDALKRAANRVNAPLTMVMFFIRRPADDNQTIDYLGRRLHHEVAFPEGLIDDEAVQDPNDKRIMDNIQEAVDNAYGPGAKVTMGIAVRCPRPKEWSKYDLAQLPDKVLARSPLYQVLSMLASDLHGLGISDVRRLSLFSMNALIRSVFDVADLKRFYADLAIDRMREKHGKLKSLNEAMTLARGPWPTQIYAHNHYLETDRTFHRIFWVKNFDIRVVPPGFFQSLFNMKDIWYQISYYIETVPGRKEYRRAANKRKYLRRGQEFLHPPGSRLDSDPRYEAESEEATRQHFDIFRSASRGTRTRFMITISSTSEEQLELDFEEVDAVCRSKGMVLQAYLGEAVQTDAMLASIGIISD